MSQSLITESIVLFRTAHDAELKATPLQLNRFAISFELYGSGEELRVSEALRCFRVLVGGRTIYAGRAVVRSLVEVSSAVVCEAELDGAAWQDLEFEPDLLRDGRLGKKFDSFLEEWQKAYLVRSDYKVLVADMQTFFAGLRLWVQQVELGLAGVAEADRDRLAREAGEIIAARAQPCVNALFERFEAFIRTLPKNVLAVHSHYMRRQMHPLVLCSPFTHRTFHKPLGYAGDYEMVNMMLRDGWEGDSLFAKIVNLLFVRQCPAQAHRNRIAYLKERLRDETLRVRRSGRKARVYNLACGPAHEVQAYLEDSSLCDSTSFTLVDFNRETLQYLTATMADILARHNRRTPVEFVQKSVYQLLKESGAANRATAAEPYDFIYCAGLFDYLSDQVCRRLMEAMYGWLAPNGLLITTNVEPSNPVREGLEHLLDWHLIYRTGQDMLRLRPSQSPVDQVRVLAEATGVNLFLEVRKPSDV